MKWINHIGRKGLRIQLGFEDDIFDSVINKDQFQKINNVYDLRYNYISIEDVPKYASMFRIVKRYMTGAFEILHVCNSYDEAEAWLQL